MHAIVALGGESDVHESNERVVFVCCRCCCCSASTHRMFTWNISNLLCLDFLATGILAYKRSPLLSSQRQQLTWKSCALLMSRRWERISCVHLLSFVSHRPSFTLPLSVFSFSLIYAHCLSRSNKQVYVFFPVVCRLFFFFFYSALEQKKRGKKSNCTCGFVWFDWFWEVDFCFYSFPVCVVCCKHC